VEELLQLYVPALASATVDLTVEYAEKSGRIEIVCECSDATVNPLDREAGEEDFGLAIIHNLAESIDCDRSGGGSRLTIKLKQAN
jgi:polar amino acid transport system ATP-binding protein